MNDISALVDKAFDYRGDVTLHLTDGSQVVGYVSNRSAKGSATVPEPHLDLMIADRVDKLVVKYAEIRDIRFTGVDAAAGKSWEEWQARKAAQKT